MRSMTCRRVCEPPIAVGVLGLRLDATCDKALERRVLAGSGAIGES